MARNDECRYCGQKGGLHGYGCAFSPNGMHAEVGDSDHCIYCGSSGYGLGCPYCDGKDPKSRPYYHRHGHGHGRCIWCGQKVSPNAMGGCPYSPNHLHEL